MKSRVIIFNAFLHFCIISRGSSIEFDNFYIEKSGHSKVKPGEIAVVFYMTVANSGVSSKKIYSKNTKCCWVHPGSGSKHDCESMDLHGGMPVILEPSKTANITYLFTNLYPLDRVGQCVFHLWQSKNKIAHTIRFNTTYQFQEDDSWFGSLYKTIAGDGKKIKACDTMDLDPRRNCRPVNCVQKYNGKRNFFRKETKLCEPVHECYTSSDDDGLPTTAFDKDHNKCKSLIQKQLTKEEERDLKDNVKSHMEASERAKFKNIGPYDSIPVRCNHGKRVGDMCVCDNGWRTDTSNVPLGDPKFVYNWCNVRTRKKPLLSYKQQKHFMIAGLSLTSFTLLVSWLWMIQRYIYPQADDHIKLIWKKTKFTSNKKELPDRVAETTPLCEDSILTPVNDNQTVPAIKSNLIQKGKGVFGFVKHSAKKLFSFRFLINEKSSAPAGSNGEDNASMSSVQQPSITDENNLGISNVPTLVQYSDGDTTQENSGSSVSVAGRAMAQQQSLAGQMTQERSSGISSTANVQQINSSIADEVSHEYASNMVEHRSLKNEGGDTSEKEILKDGNHVSFDDNVVKESSRIVATRRTRAGSTFTLAGPEDPQLTQKRLSSSSPVFDNFSDSD